MAFLQYLLTAFLALMAFGCWLLVNATRQATDGFQDEFGFHFGIPPAVTSLYPALASSIHRPAEQARASVPAVPKRRRSAGSKPPMLPANLQAGDLNPRPADQAKHARKSPSASDQNQAQSQIAFPPPENPSSPA